MNKFIIIGLLFLTLGLGYLAFNYFGLQYLWIDSPVPTLPSEALSQFNQPTQPTNDPAPIIDKTEKISPVLSANFVPGDSTYKIDGSVLINDKSLLLKDFSVTNGPDLFVYIVRDTAFNNDAVKTKASVQPLIDLGKLQGNRGDQIYDLPEGYTPQLGDIVLIWCLRFSRNFGMAEIKPI